MTWRSRGRWRGAGRSRCTRRRCGASSTTIRAGDGGSRARPESSTSPSRRRLIMPAGVRTNTVAGFPTMQPYQELIARYEKGRTYQKIGPINQVVEGAQSVGAGDMAMKGTLAKGAAGVHRPAAARQSRHVGRCDPGAVRAPAGGSAGGALSRAASHPPPPSSRPFDEAQDELRLRRKPGSQRDAGAALFTPRDPRRTPG